MAAFFDFTMQTECRAESLETRCLMWVEHAHLMLTVSYLSDAEVAWYEAMRDSSRFYDC